MGRFGRDRLLVLTYYMILVERVHVQLVRSGTYYCVLLIDHSHCTTIPNASCLVCTSKYIIMLSKQL